MTLTTKTRCADQLATLIRVAAVLMGVAIALLSPNLSANPLKSTSKRPDGSTIYWSIEHPETSTKSGILLIAHGFGCLPAVQDPSILPVKSIAPNYSVLLVEKYGVTHNDAPQNPDSSCSESYFSHHSIGQRVADVKQVIDQLREADWWNGELVLFGGSEGGVVVAQLTPELVPRATIIFPHGVRVSLDGETAREMPPFAMSEAKQRFSAVLRNQDSNDIENGESYQWWADILGITWVKELLKVEVPVLLLQGDRDKVASVQLARAARDVYVAEGRCELTYWELPGYDHSMNDRNGVNHRDVIFARISSWLESTLASDVTNC